MKDRKSMFAIIFGLLFLVTQFSPLVAKTKSGQKGEKDIDIYVLAQKKNKESIEEKFHEHKTSVDLETWYQDEITLSNVINSLKAIASKNIPPVLYGEDYEIVYLGGTYKDVSNQQKKMLQEAIDTVVELGATVIVPAGDDGRKIQTENAEVLPASLSNTMTIGTVTPPQTTNKQWSFRNSNFGEEVDLVNVEPAVSENTTRDAAIKALKFTQAFYKSALRKGHRPSPRLVRHELVKKQSSQLQVEIDGQEKQLRLLSPAEFKGDRVSEPSDGDQSQQKKGYAINGSTVKYHYDLDLRKNQFDTEHSLKDVLYEIFSFDSNALTVELEETKQKITGITIKGFLSEFGNKNNPYFYHLVDAGLNGIEGDHGDFIREFKEALLKMNNNSHTSITGVHEGDISGYYGHLIFGIKLKVNPKDLK